MTEFSKTFLVFYKWPDLTEVQGIRTAWYSSLIDTYHHDGRMGQDQQYPTQASRF